MSKQPQVTTVRLARPVEDGSRVVDAVTIKGDTGPSQFPMGRAGENAEIDMLVVQRVVASRTGLSEVAISRLSGLDFFGIYFALFIVQSPRRK
jgi:hypothetical protein